MIRLISTSGGGGFLVVSPHPTDSFIRENYYDCHDTTMSLETKYCKRCDRTLPTDRFSKDKKYDSGLAFYCKDCASDYGKKYRARKRTDPHHIYQQTCANQKHYKHKDVEISECDFTDWYVNEDKVCCYCDLPEEYIYIMNENFSGRAHRLTVDCKDNSLGYVDGNLVLSCGVCNLLKNDFFTYEEFRDIGQRYVKPRWQEIKSKE